MFPFDNWPFMDWHKLNLDWILSTFKRIAGEVTDTANRAEENSKTAMETADRAEANSVQAVEIANQAEANSLQAIEKADTAVTTANVANDKADNAIRNANVAVRNSEQAIETADNANNKSDNAVVTANQALGIAQDANSQSRNALNIANDAIRTSQEAVNIAGDAVENAANSAEQAMEAKEAAENAASIVEGYNDRLVAAETNITNINSTIDEDIEPRVVSLETGQDIQDGKITNAESDIADLDTRVAALEAGGGGGGAGIYTFMSRDGTVAETTLPNGDVFAVYQDDGVPGAYYATINGEAINKNDWGMFPAYIDFATYHLYSDNDGSYYRFATNEGCAFASGASGFVVNCGNTIVEYSSVNKHISVNIVAGNSKWVIMASGLQSPCSTFIGTTDTEFDFDNTGTTQIRVSVTESNTNLPILEDVMYTIYLKNY